MTFSRSSVSRPAGRLLLALALVSGLFGGVATTSAPPAQAAAISASVAVRALQFAASRRGSPYQWGATGPRRFDCSGLTQWAYRHAGKRLPRTAAQQYYATARVSRAHARRGDLVFFISRAQGIHHVGIYAGNGMIWNAPHTGTRVRLQRIWSSAAVFHRVRR